MGACRRSRAPCFFDSRADPRVTRPPLPARGFFLSRTTRRSSPDEPDERAKTMSQDQAAPAGESEGGAATYDIEAVEAKWYRVWEDLQPFKASDDVVQAGVRE